MKMHLLLPAMVLLACATQTAQQETHMPDDYLIAYNVHVPDSAHSENYDVFTMNMDGSDKKNITKHPDVAWTYASVNQTLFFLSDRDTTNRVLLLYEMDGEGNSLRRINNFRLQDSWLGQRKDGAELIIKPHTSIAGGFYIINRNGALISKLNPGTPYCSDPAFSQDGSRVAFVGKNKASKREPGYEAEIYTVNTDGTELRQLTRYPKHDTTAAWFDYKAGPPRWHPSGDFITFQSKQHGKYNLYGVMADGSKQWKLIGSQYNEGWHDWSPDGQWLAIELFDNNQEQFHIGLMHWKSKELKILTDTTYRYQQAPVFVKKPS